MDLLDRMLGHDQWTTKKLLNMSRDLTDAQFDQEFDIGHRTLRETFGHMIFNVGSWTAVMAGRPPDSFNEDLSVAALLERHERSYATFAELARTLQAEQRLDEHFSDFYDYPQSFGGTILHVVEHNHQHRSEVLHIFQRLGGLSAL